MPNNHPHALIVDDNDDIREVLEYFVSTGGYSVTGARNGREALERLQTERPCIIVLDLMMPDMTGPQFREAQLADAALRDIPVVIYSAAFGVAETAARLGVAAYLDKSSSVIELLQLVRQHCLK